MGLRDRMKKLLVPVAAPPAPAVQAPPRAELPPPPRTWPAPRARSHADLAGAAIVDARTAALPPIAGAVREVDGATWRPGRPVVVVCEDGSWSSGLAERLAAQGVPDVGWLDGGWTT